YNRQNTKLEATNPSTKRYLDKDIYTYIAALPAEQMDVDAAKALNDSLKYEMVEVAPGDTVFGEDFSLVVSGLSIYPEAEEYIFEPGDLGIQVSGEITNLRD